MSHPSTNTFDNGVTDYKLLEKKECEDIVEKIEDRLATALFFHRSAGKSSYGAAQQTTTAVASKSIRKSKDYNDQKNKLNDSLVALDESNYSVVERWKKRRICLQCEIDKLKKWNSGKATSAQRPMANFEHIFSIKSRCRQEATTSVKARSGNESSKSAAEGERNVCGTSCCTICTLLQNLELARQDLSKSVEEKVIFQLQLYQGQARYPQQIFAPPTVVNQSFISEAASGNSCNECSAAVKNCDGDKNLCSFEMDITRRSSSPSSAPPSEGLSSDSSTTDDNPDLSRFTVLGSELFADLRNTFEHHQRKRKQAISRERRRRKKAEKERLQERQGRMREHQEKLQEREARMQEHQEKLQERQARMQEHLEKLQEREARMQEREEKHLQELSSFCREMKSNMIEFDKIIYDLCSFGNEKSTVQSSKPIHSETDGIDQQKLTLSASGLDYWEHPEEIPYEDIVKSSGLADLTSDKVNKLMKFQEFLQRIFLKANQATNSETFESYQVKLTCDKILNGFLGTDALPKGSTQTSTQDSPPIHLPPPKACEIKGSHPILYAILFKIAELIELDVQITREQATLAVDNSSGRRIDLVLNRISEYLRGVLAFMCFLPVEIKVVLRERVSFQVLLQQGAKQVTGHIAKALYHAFHFGGIGIHKRCRGAVLTLASIEVLTIEIENFGSSNMKLMYKRSRPYPLFNKETFIKLMGGQNVPKIVRCYDDVFGDRTPEQGFFVLASLLFPAKQFDVPFPVGKIGCNGEPLKVLKFLGAGSFSSVYQLSNDKILKIPQSIRLVPSLKNEMALLQQLNHDSIPKVVETQLSEVTFSVRCELSTIQCLILRSKVGEPASEGRLNPDAILMISRKVYNALLHAHQNKVVHLDVRPGNIVVCKDVNSNINDVVLIDWGSGGVLGSNMSCFRGSLPYAHDELLVCDFNKVKVTRERKYDFASLAHTMACMIYRWDNASFGVPWHGFSGVDMDDEKLGHRRTIAKACLSRLAAHDTQYVRLIKAIQKLSKGG